MSSESKPAIPNVVAATVIEEKVEEKKEVKVEVKEEKKEVKVEVKEEKKPDKKEEGANGGAGVPATVIPSPTTLIDIKKYNKMFVAYPEELQKFCDENKIKLPGIETLRGQAYALMGQPEVRGQLHLSRTETFTFFKQIGVETDDAIQPFNKTIGLKRIKGRGLYCLVYPFETDTVDIDKRKGASIKGDRDSLIDRIKNWWRQNLVDVPNKDWQVGHLDPTIGDASEANLAYQPPIQGKYRNRFKWDALFQRMWPTAEEWISKMDTYHTEEEQKKMLAALKKKWEK